MFSTTGYLFLGHHISKLRKSARRARNDKGRIDKGGANREERKSEGARNGKGRTLVVPLCVEIRSALQRLRLAFWRLQGVSETSSACPKHPITICQ